MNKPKLSDTPEQVRVSAAIAALNAVGALPLLEALRDAQVDALEAELGSRAVELSGLLCVDGFCVEPFLDPIAALEIPNYDVTEIVEICLRCGPWARVNVSARWREGRGRKHGELSLARWSALRRLG